MTSDTVTSPAFVFAPAPITTLPVRGTTAVFPVRRVFCVGRNYAEHALEMGADPTREEPFFFQKNPENLICGRNFPYPPLSSDVHHEVELAVTLKDGGSDIPVDAGLSKIFGYAVAIDFTRRDLQAAAKKAGRPWASGKAFEASAPISEIAPASQIGHPDAGSITLKRNDVVVQQGDLSQLIWKVPEIIAELSKQFELAAGDVILTGTPAGVGPVVRGDRIACNIDGVGELNLKVV
jgi:fumarylpyruvate hydrolase